MHAASGTLARAQYRAGLQGTVTDTTGAVVPNASVTILDKETNQTQTVKTDGAGTYTFNRLAPAAYTVTVEAPGFAKRIVDDVTVSGETMQALNVTLGAEGGSQTITVTDTSPAINTATATSLQPSRARNSRRSHHPTAIRTSCSVSHLAHSVMAHKAVPAEPTPCPATAESAEAPPPAASSRWKIVRRRRPTAFAPRATPSRSTEAR